MRHTGKRLPFYLLPWLFYAFAGSAGTLDTVGVTTLLAVNPSITGTGVRVAQVESTISGPLDFEVNPSAVGQPVSLFTWYSFAGTASTYPNAVGSESGHANGVGNYFYGSTSGVAPGVSHVDNYEANFFISTVVQAAASIPAKIVSQSFIFDRASEPTANIIYDDYAATRGVLFVSAVGNDGAPYAPGTAYNSIGVGALGEATQSSIGPTSNGRCKPDIVAPENVTSFSTPQVAGAAALLIQTANSLTNTAAADIRTLKALLLNGAVKPLAWTNSPAQPLDFRYGAGMLNVFNSYKQMTTARVTPVETTSNAAGSSHPPGVNPANISSAVGWAFHSITNQGVGPNVQERVNHYYFTLPAGAASTLTATLAWNIHSDTTNLNNLDLFLYNCANSNLVALSTSLVDNVEHLFLPALPAGRYDLQVLKKTAGVSNDETYALALETFKQSLSIVRSGTNVAISWPVYPDGFILESISALGSTNTWSTAAASPVVTNNFNRVVLPASGNQFYRLRRP